MSTQARGKHTSPTADLTDFHAHTGRLYVAKDAQGYPANEGACPRLYGIGSSTLEDLDGDRMLPSALQDMCQFPPDSLCFLNHSYLLPEDGFGQMVDSPAWNVLVAAVDTPYCSRGDRYGVVELAMDLFDTNPRAMQTYSYAAGRGSRRPARIGISVGCKVTDYDILTDSDGYPLGYIIAHLITTEFSSVGIPAVQQAFFTGTSKGYEAEAGIAKSPDYSWPAQARKALIKRRGLELPADETEIARVVRNWDDFDREDQVVLRKINNILDQHGMCVAYRYAQSQGVLN